MREPATGESLQLPVHVILHAPDGRLEVIQQEIRSSAIAVVRETDAAGVGDDNF
jgi:hypothetical protein